MCIRDRDYFTIEGCYGGNQDWFTNLVMHMGGCAAATACDSCIYFGLQNEKMKPLYPFDIECLTKEDYKAVSYTHLVIEDLARIPVRVELASEFRYRNPILDPKGLVIIISQSGETADSLAALRESKEMGIKTLGIVNVIGSSIAREADNVFYTLAGPEISVATDVYKRQGRKLYHLPYYM